MAGISIESWARADLINRSRVAELRAFRMRKEVLAVVRRLEKFSDIFKFKTPASSLMLICRCFESVCFLVFNTISRIISSKFSVTSFSILKFAGISKDIFKP